MAASEFEESLPDLAVEWAGAIADDSKRTAVLKEIAETWIFWDTRAAEAWLRDAPLPADFKTRLLEEYAR